MVRTGRQGAELVPVLLALDQKYPDRLELKIDLGAALIASGQAAAAGPFLKRGEALLRWTTPARLRYLLYANLAEQALRVETPVEAAGCATKALEADKADPVGAIFTRAKAFFRTGDREEAIRDFSTGWADRRDRMGAEDLTIFLSLLTETGHDARALEVLQELVARFGYAPGYGLQESLLLERLGSLPESILAAFWELEFQRFHQGLAKSRILENLELLNRNLADGKWSAHSEGKLALSALSAYSEGRWEKAAKELRALPLEHPSLIREYLFLSAALESGKASSAETASYMKLEPYFRNDQGYYFHLWHGLDASGRLASYESSRRLLEHCILCAPASPFALETRRRLGRLIGIPEIEGERLLLQSELDDLARRLVLVRDPALLEKAMALLDTRDNAYQMRAMLMLREVRSIPWVAEQMTRKREKAVGRMKDRLAMVLDG